MAQKSSSMSILSEPKARTQKPFDSKVTDRTGFSPRNLQSPVKLHILSIAEVPRPLCPHIYLLLHLQVFIFQLSMHALSRFRYSNTGWESPRYSRRPTTTLRDVVASF